jgi:hypothetical protein
MYPRQNNKAGRSLSGSHAPWPSIVTLIAV